MNGRGWGVNGTSSPGQYSVTAWGEGVIDWWNATVRCVRVRMRMRVCVRVIAIDCKVHVM